VRVALVEDEVPALDQLERLLLAIRPDAAVVTRLRTVRQTRAWLADPGRCDLVLADIELGDGLSLDAFADSELDVPVVFVTAYDHYLTAALAEHGIAYLLKPVDRDALAAALTKLDRLERHFVGALGEVARRLTESPARIVGRRGLDWVGVPVEAIRWVRVRNGITTAATADGDTLMLDESLSRLETQLGPAGFLRVNRWYLACLEGVARVRSAGRGRLELVLDPPAEEPVVVPQEQAAAFRTWFGIR